MFGIGFISIFAFQSPRSGQICSNNRPFSTSLKKSTCFNPLDRVKFVQINVEKGGDTMDIRQLFQSPRSGQICSNSIPTLAMG